MSALGAIKALLGLGEPQAPAEAAQEAPGPAQAPRQAKVRAHCRPYAGVAANCWCGAQHNGRR